jgi:hypothetical protein
MSFIIIFTVLRLQIYERNKKKTKRNNVRRRFHHTHTYVCISERDFGIRIRSDFGAAARGCRPEHPTNAVYFHFGSFR